MAQAREKCGDDQDKTLKWLEGSLTAMGPQQAQNFHEIMHGYVELADQYGLWTAANIMLDGCSHGGFNYFRAWLVWQGKDIYMAALKDPDSLTDVPVHGNGRFESLSYVGAYAYEKLTEKDVYDATDWDEYEKLKETLKQDIVYGKGINYPYRLSEATAYLPGLCAKYLTPEQILVTVLTHDDMWNSGSPDIQKARATVPKGRKNGHKRGGNAR